MDWKPDKQRHYTFCYEVTNKIPKCVKTLGGLAVFTVVSCKEILDAFGMGHPEVDDIKANWTGVLDAIQNKKNRFE